MPGDSHAVSDVLDELVEVASQDARVQVGELLEALGHRGIGVFLFVPGLLELSPIGGIPGVPTLLAAIVLVFALQILTGRDHMWLPAFAQRRSISSARVTTAARTLRPVADRLDRWFQGRLDRLVRAPFTRLAAAMSTVLALTVPPLEIVPFASSAPMGAIAAFGLALLVRDGVLMLLASVLSVLAIGIVGWVVLG